MSCIFCFPTPPSADLTREHVVPEAIGGSLVIESVCKNCNDRLGSDVDAQLVENFLIKMIRLGLRLATRDGTIPSPLINGRLRGTEEVGSFRVAAGAEKGTVTVRPRVEKHVNEDGNVEKHFIAEPREFEQIRQQLEARAARDGQEMVLRGPDVTTVASPVIEKTETAELSSLARSFLKIAYEYAAIHLGDAYISTETAAQLRREITGSAAVETNVGFVLAPTGTVLSSGSWPSYFHALRLIRSGDQIVCNLRIFNIFEAGCPVAAAADFPQFASPGITLLDPLDKTILAATDATIGSKPGTGIQIRHQPDKLVITTTFEGAETGTSTIGISTVSTLAG